MVNFRSAELSRLLGTGSYSQARAGDVKRPSLMLAQEPDTLSRPALLIEEEVPRRTDFHKKSHLISQMASHFGFANQSYSIGMSFPGISFGLIIGIFEPHLPLMALINSLVMNP